MAVKARASITLVKSVDIDSVYWFYLLQSSTAAAPSVPSSVPATKGNPPSGWSRSEPTNVDINKTLYIIELTYFTDGTGIYSTVSVSSSYEAAKVAYNHSVNVQNNLDDAYDKLQSKGEQLVVNGSAFMGDNTNFSNWTFDGSVANGTKGSFTKPGTWAGTPLTDERFPIDITKRYRFEFDAKSKDNTSKHYSFLNFYDVDGNAITASNHMNVSGSLTTLAQDLKNGDTVVYLTSAAGWSVSSSTATHMLGFIFWNYTNSYGYTYPENTYSRNVWTNLYTYDKVDKTNNKITLTSAWNHGTFPAGTKVSQSKSGGNYKYTPLSNSKVPTTWTHYTGYFEGVDYSGNNAGGKFPPGTATAKVGFLWNYQTQSTTDQLWITNVSVMEDLKTSISTAQTTATNAATAASNAQATADSKKSMIKINAPAKSFTTANWKTYGAAGHSENWSTGSSYSNPDIKVGDTAYIVGTVTDGAKGSATVIGTVTAINGTNGTTSIVMTSQQLIFGGDSVYTAYSTASTAKSTADTAKSTADTAKTTADEAKAATDELQPELIVGTHGTTATATWTGTSTKLKSISSGTTIRYKLSSAGASNVTLNLTLANGTTTGAKNVYYKYSGTRLSTQYPINSIIELVYDGTQWHVATPYTNDNTYDRVRFNGAVKANNASGYGAITAGNIIVGTSAGYHHLKNGKAFDINYPILYCGSNISSGGTNTNNYTVYPVTITTTQSITLTAYKAVYIKGTLAGSQFTPVSTSPLTQTEPTSATDTYYYMRLGLAYAADKMYLESDHPIYRWSAGAFRLFGSSADEIVSAWCKDTTVTVIGNMEFNGAKIATGTVEADKINVNDLSAFNATIGGFALESNSIHTSGVAITSNASNSVALSSSTFTRTIGGESISNLKFAIGGNFGIDNDGSLYASSATISGMISANSGVIGKWKIVNSLQTIQNAANLPEGSLYYGDRAGSEDSICLVPQGSLPSNATIAGYSRNDWKIMVGNAFGVKGNGDVIANNAIFKNSVYAYGSMAAESFTTTGTLKDQISNSDISVYSWDHFVFFSGDGISVSNFSTYIQTWCNGSSSGQSGDWRIKDGWRPIKNVWFPFIYSHNGFRMGCMQIRTDGYINAYIYPTYGSGATNMKTEYRNNNTTNITGSDNLFFNASWMRS